MGNAGGCTHTVRAVLGGRASLYALHRAGAPLTYGDALRRLAGDADFRACLTALIADSGYVALRWETPPIRRTTLDRAFEFVLVDDPCLETAPEPEVFEGYFAELPAATTVRAVSNLGRTGLLIVPRRLGDPRVYTHFVAFLRSAPAEQVDALWQCVAATALGAIAEEPLWVSTAGGGVAWLHVRIERMPKYYNYRPYAIGG